jgi:hypothetical protein
MWRNIRRRVAGSLAVCLVLLTLGTASGLYGQDKGATADNQPVSFWMKKKLEFSQNILAGLAAADFDRIVENAQATRNLSKIEGFIRGQTPGYRTQLRIFEESADEIVRQAQRDNVEGAALAFTQLTISCVNCHKQLRGQK